MTVPVQWRQVTAGELGTFKGGSGFPVRFQGEASGKYPFFKVSDMNLPGNEISMISANNYVSESVRGVLGATTYPAGSIVFAKVGAAVFLERKRILAASSCIDNNMSAFVVNASAADPKFIYHVLTGFRLASLVAVGALPSLNGRQLRSIPVILPPTLGEQRAIASVLDDADELIEASQRLLTKKRAIQRGMEQELLTGRTRLPGFDSDWDQVTLGSLGSTYGGLVGKAGKDFGRGEGRYVTFTEVMRSPRLRGTALGNVVVKPGERQTAVRRGDVLFNGSSETPNEVALAAAVEFDAPNVYLNSFCFGYRPARQDILDPLFLAYYFRTEIGRELVASLAQGSTRYNIAKSKLVKAVLTVPSYAEQVAISAALREAGCAIDALEARLESARAIKQGMMQELLTGRTRLVADGVAA